jgi:hypothetical protein
MYQDRTEVDRSLKRFQALLPFLTLSQSRTQILILFTDTETESATENSGSTLPVSEQVTGTFWSDFWYVA